MCIRDSTQLVKDKTGVKIDGLTAINPVNGREIPVYISDYVMMGYEMCIRDRLYDEYQLTRREAAALEIEIDDYSLAAKRLAELKSQIRALGSVNVLSLIHISI